MTKLVTWGEFKRAVEAQGVTDDTKLAFIDWGHGPPAVDPCGDAVAITNNFWRGPWEDGTR